MTQKPTPSSIILTFKSATSTLFVFTTPSSTVLSVKQQLQSMLESNSAHLPDSVPVPSSPGEIFFGKPKDTSDPKKGFVKMNNIPTGSKGNSMKVDAAGFKDNGVYAFKVTQDGVNDDNEDDEDSDEGDFEVQFPIDDYGDSQGISQAR